MSSTQISDRPVGRPKRIQPPRVVKKEVELASIGPLLVSVSEHDEKRPRVEDVTQMLLSRNLFKGKKLRGKGSMSSSMCGTFESYFSSTIVVNGSATKYLQYLDGVSSLVSLTWTKILLNLDEISSWSLIFSEVFVHWVELEYYPRNKYSSNTTASSTPAGSPGDLNTCGATIAFVPHNTAAYSDISAAWYTMRAATQSKSFNLADNMVFRAHNMEKFAWDGPLGDMTTSATTMSWCTLSALSKLGGLFQLATADASGAAVGIGNLLEGGVFGDYIVKVRYSLRSRI